MTKKQKKYTILIAEDDKLLNKLYKISLENQGFKVLMVSDGDLVIQSALDQQPDLILLDLILPGYDGFEILSNLKQNPKTNPIPVCVLSNLAQKEDIEQAKSLGAEDFLVKSHTEMSDLGKHINQILNKL